LAKLEQERAKQIESVLVKENEEFRSELAKMRREVQKLSSLYGKCQQDKNQAERDLVRRAVGKTQHPQTYSFC